MPTELDVDPLAVLQRRTSAKWRVHDAEVLPKFVAETDYPLAAPVADALRDAIDRGDTGYARAGREVADSLAGFAQRRWGWTIDPGGVLAVADVGVGARQVLSTVVEPGDTVVFSTPVYRPFTLWMQAVGAQAVDVPFGCDDAGRLRLDLAGLREAFATRPKAYLLCNPANPTGVVPSHAELTELAALAAEFGVTVVSDEIHAPLVLDDSFVPFLTVPGGTDVGIALTSASKAWNVAGLKCAQVVAQSASMRALLDRVPPELSWDVGQLGVVAARAAFDEGEPWLDDLIFTLRARRDELGELLATQLPAVRWVPPQASYLAWLDCRLLGLGVDPALAFLQRGRVALEPGPVFGPSGRGHARLNYATSAEILAEGVRRMAATLST